MKPIFRSILYCVFWYGSIFAGFLFIACPLLPLLLISPKLFRKCGDLLFACWELYPTVLLEVLGVKIAVSGDHIRSDDGAVLIMNHRTRVDWNFLWGAMYQACMPKVASHNMKFVLKDPIRHVPGAGWTMQMNHFLYITRRWEEDRGRLARSIDYLTTIGRRTQLLIFPEGTDLTPNSRERSDRYAEKNGLMRHIYTLHPKTTGFSYIVRHLQESKFIDAVYDITIAYPDKIPQTEVQMLVNGLPEQVHFHIRRISISKLPNDDTALRNWLQNCWSHKERFLQDFHSKKSFSSEYWQPAKRLPLSIAFVFWTSLTIITWAMLLMSPLFQIWTLVNSLFFIGLSLFSGGFNELEIKWYWKWKSIVSKEKE